jgi:hypothetical protein
MMIAFAYSIGLGLPAMNGYLLLGLLANRTNALNRMEQWTAGAVISMTVGMFLMFCVHVSLGLPLSRNGFLLVQGGLLVVLGILSFVMRSKATTSMVEPPSEQRLPRWMQIILWTLVGWVVLRAVAAATVFLFLTPTYLDDSLDNWNLRGKLFFEDQAITLALPGEDPEVSRITISSYPPAVPMIKTWIASLAGEWSDPAANGIHLFYYLAALLILAQTVRKLAGKGWGLFAAYLLGSMPLYLMHGTNPYADAFLSVHVLLAVIFPLRAFYESDPARRMALLRIGALCAALLPFTKNEGLLVYLPPLMLIGGIGLTVAVRKGTMTLRDALTAIAWYAGCLLVLALPWLIFKWSNGLTFGNAKSFTALGIGWQSGVLIAIAVNTFFEGNWLLFFPLLIGLLIWRRHAAFNVLRPLTAYVLIVFTGQMMLFLFTGLAVEARMQTGLARSGVQLMPSLILLATLLLADATPVLARGFLALRRSVGILRS